ncbi:hypothetical protein GWI34_33560 [Actinomadura sp. DSM 109109]|nr:hypothetical protein [Actinomadura lepetitiana]
MRLGDLPATNGLATAAGKGTMAAAGVAVAAATAGGAVYAVQDGKSTPTPSPAPAAVVTLAADNQTLTGPAIQLQNARYPKVTGLRNPALERKVNAALHEPIDRLVASARRLATSVDCKGKPVKLGTETRLGLRGPRLVSVRYFMLSDNCQQADGSPGGEVVTVDLRTGRRLTAADVFLPATLTPAGARRLSELVPQKPSPNERRWRDCDPTGVFELSDILPRKGTQGAPGMEGTPFLSPFFTPTGFELSFLAGGSDGCGNLNFGAPYASVRGLLKPEIAALLPSSPAPKRS